MAMTVQMSALNSIYVCKHMIWDDNATRKALIECFWQPKLPNQDVKWCKGGPQWGSSKLYLLDVHCGSVGKCSRHTQKSDRSVRMDFKKGAWGGLRFRKSAWFYTCWYRENHVCLALHPCPFKLRFRWKQPPKHLDGTELFAESILPQSFWSSLY